MTASVPQDGGGRPESRPRTLAVIVSVAFIGGLVLSLLEKAPSKLPGIAMDWPLLLHVLRASAVAGLFGIGALIVVRLWGGELPTKVSTTGAEWAAPVQAPDREVSEQLLRVERESKATTDALREIIERLLGTAPDPAPDARELLRSVDAALWRWDAELGKAEMKDALADAIGSLPERERLLIALMYYEGLSLRDVAAILGVSESAASQLQ